MNPKRIERLELAIKTRKLITVLHNDDVLKVLKQIESIADTRDELAVWMYDDSLEDALVDVTEVSSIPLIEISSVSIVCDILISDSLPDVLRQAPLLEYVAPTATCIDLSVYYHLEAMQGIKTLFVYFQRDDGTLVRGRCPK